MAQLHTIHLPGTVDRQIGVYINMRMRWRLILCIWGLTLFGLMTYGSLGENSRLNRFAGGRHDQTRYFWWGSVRLDSDPLNKRPRLNPCVDESNGNCIFDPEYVWVGPGLMERAFVLTALPAFLLEFVVIHGLARLGVSELQSFLFTMPLLTVVWFYVVGWLLDRWLHKRASGRTPA